MKLGLCGLSILTVLTLVRAAEAAPAWCGDTKVRSEGSLDSALTSDDAAFALRDLVGASCNPDGEERDRAPEIAEARARWSKKLGMQDADWADAAAYAQLDLSARRDDVRIVGDQNYPRIRDAWSAMTPIDQYAAIVRGGGASDDLALDKAYLTDAFGAKLTATGRFGYAHNCLTQTGTPVEWAMCQPDVDAIDAAKINAELRSDSKYTPADRMRVRIEIDRMQPKIADRKAKLKALIASDPGYARMFEIAAAVRQEWDQRYRDDAALLDLLAKLDDAQATQSRRAFEGCAAPAWAAWQAGVRGFDRKKLEDLKPDPKYAMEPYERAAGMLLADTHVYMGALAMVSCHGGVERDQQHDAIIQQLSKALQVWPGARGPRTATQTAIMLAGIEFDRRDLQLRFPGVNRFYGTRDIVDGGGQGIIAKLKPAGDQVKVEFKPDIEKEEVCAEAVYNNRILEITSNGTIVYDYTCKRTEINTRNKASKPTEAAAAQMQGLKPGMYVSILGGQVMFARAKPGGAMVTLFGVPLK